MLAWGCDGDVEQDARRVGAKRVQVRRGDTYRWGAVKAKVLSPKSVSGDANADSVVLLLEVAGRRILLTGDLTGPNEAIVGELCARGPPLDVLKVAHHGSRSSTSASFLADADAKIAIICVGANAYGHPTPETFSRLRAPGARVNTTMRNGTITLTIGRTGSWKWQYTKTSAPLKKVTATVSAGSRQPSRASTTAGGSGVFVTATGECYHRGSCRYLSKSEIAISLKQAKAKGYRPCSVCRPPS